MILAIKASGRHKANSSALIDAVTSRAAQGVEVVTHELSKLDFKGCTGCGACRKGAPGCVLDDGLTPVLADLTRASAVVLGSPNYYGYVSGIFKSFLDRWYGFRDGERNLRMPEGRPLLMIYSQGHPDPEAYLPMSQSMDKIFSGYGFRPRRLVAPGMEAAAMAEENLELRAQAHQLGDELAKALQR